MNGEKELKKKAKELKIIDNIIIETLILSQQKYDEYINEKRRLENELNQLKENIDKPKIIKTWKEKEDGWRQRIYKYE